MGFAVFHIQKGKGSAGGLGGHIDRTYDVKNADKEREHLNFKLTGSIDNEQRLEIRKGSYEGTINDRERLRIQKGHTGRKIRDNAVTRLHFVLSGSHEEMKKVEAGGKINEWAEQNYKFIAEKFGNENIIEFAVHLDEKTPHIHAIVVPINSETKTLNAKSMMSRQHLKSYQTDYANAMSDFGLKRGIEGSRSTHETVAEFYKKIENPNLQGINIMDVDYKIFDTKTDLKEKAQKKINEQVFQLAESIKLKEEKRVFQIIEKLKEQVNEKSRENISQQNYMTQSREKIQKLEHYLKAFSKSELQLIKDLRSGMSSENSIQKWLNSNDRNQDMKR